MDVLNAALITEFETYMLANSALSNGFIVWASSLEFDGRKFRFTFELIEHMIVYIILHLLHDFLHKHGTKNRKP